MTQWTPPSQRPVMTLSIPRAWLPLLALAAALAILFPATLLGLAPLMLTTAWCLRVLLSSGSKGLRRTAGA